VRGIELKMKNEKCKMKSLGGERHSLLPCFFRSSILTFSFFIFHFAFSLPVSADESPKYAERGVSAYNAGKYDLARMFFSKALQDAVLKGNEDWILKATLNLVDLELEANDEREAFRLLEGMNPRARPARSLWLWKRSQLAFLQRRHPLAMELVDSAIDLAKGDPAKLTTLGLDRMRYLIQSKDPSAWSSDYERLRKGLNRTRSVPLDAMASMARKDFDKADTLWREAMGYYRDQGRLAKVAGCLNQSALCLFSLGRRQEALEVNARAVAIYGELGLEIPGLKAQALRLLLVEDGPELAKLRQDMDLVGQRISGFDLQGILDEYSHNLRIDRPGLGN
jgi:tetratricopeptide (TPR) repeat protein